MLRKLQLLFILVMCGILVQAQYINTDSLVVVPGFSTPVLAEMVGKMHLIEAGHAYELNLTATGLIMQFSMPVLDGKIISHYGPRSGRKHTGTDIKMAKGDTIYASFNGKVNRSQYYYGYGNMVVLDHGKSIETYYAHLSKMLVKNGDWVKKGQPVGLAGATGRATTSHLHFEIRENDNPYDPELVFDFENNRVRQEISSLETLAELHVDHKPKSNYTKINTPITQNYIVRSGDSLYKISKRAKTSIQALCQLNQLTESSILQIGQVIKVY